MKQWTLNMSKYHRGILDSKKGLQCMMLCIALLAPSYATASTNVGNEQKSFYEVTQPLSMMKETSNVSPIDNSVRGTIIDEKGVPLPGVSVAIKGTSTGVISDINGYYIINAKAGDILVFSFVGFKSQEITVGKKPALDIVMKEDVHELEETVIVGMGKQRKASVIGSISSVSIKELEVPQRNLTNALSGRIAGALGLDNLIMFYDSNDIQLSTETKDVTVEDTAMKYEAWGWNVLSINGNDPDEIRAAIKEAQAEKERPTLIIGKTVMGKGARKADGSSYEANCATHGAPLGGDAYVNTIKNLGGDPTNPFVIFPEVAELYAKRAEELKKIVAEKYAKKAAWAKANPELAAKLELFFSGKAPKVDWAAIEQKAGSATRAASATVLGALATQVENMIVASADLSNSDKTDGFLKKTHSFKKGDFSGAFFQAGVSELSMACICIGMSLHGGVIAACGTFFVFSDYMKPAVRMAALMEQPVKFIWTHDAFRVGEDGPTHEPVEQEAQIRLMEKLKNHKGHNSMLVLRPADAEETTIAWKLAMENMSTPTGLIFSRQNIANLPAGTDYEQAAKGAYIVAGSDENPDVILVASGSEVSTLVAGTELLRKDGVKVRIVSAPSEGLFRNQPKEYQEAILPADAKIFGMTAGLPVTLQGLVGCHGKVWGLESFGFSAPYKVLDEKLGFTAENVYNQVKAML